MAGRWSAPLVRTSSAGHYCYVPANGEEHDSLALSLNFYKQITSIYCGPLTVIYYGEITGIGCIGLSRTDHRSRGACTSILSGVVRRFRRIAVGLRLTFFAE